MGKYKADRNKLAFISRYEAHYNDVKHHTLFTSAKKLVRYNVEFKSAFKALLRKVLSVQYEDMHVSRVPLWGGY